MTRVTLFANVKPVLALAALLFLASCSPSAPVPLEQHDRIAIVGNSLADRMQHSGWLETWLQAAYPEHELVVRNLGFTGDRVQHRPRAHRGFGDADEHLTNTGASVIFAFFGYNESFDDDPHTFFRDLRVWVQHVTSQTYNGVSAPRVVLFSPIAHEDLGDPNLPDGRENNQRLAAYTQAIKEVAQLEDLPFIDLFEASKELYNRSEQPLTINGVHLNDEGYRLLSEHMARSLLGRLPRTSDSALERIRLAVVDKNWHWFNKYRATSGNDVWGSRASLHGNRETLQHELVMIDAMTASRDRVVWDAARGRVTEPDDSNVPDPLPVVSNFLETGHARGHRDGQVVFLDGTEALDKLHLSEGLSANLFASEAMFPELANPVQMQVDPQGRLWVATWPTYPKWEPLKEMNDRLLILEDTTGDGVADKSTTFAYVHNPTGFEFWNGGVIVVSAPDILFLRDTTGDNKADVVIRLLGGIDSADTHHTANNLVLGPDGYIYYQRGVFHLNNVETPWGPPVESRNDGMYRFNPRTFHFEFVASNGPNAHGISFDRWGYQFATDGTSGRAIQVYKAADTLRTRRLLNHSVRPVTGNMVLSSDHFPPDFQENFLIFNVIGFLGSKRYQLTYDNDAVWGEPLEDLFWSDDPNFRPTDGVVGNDGALYISDWHNPTVGHMQHNLRDPIRDKVHGRIYRITYEGRPLSEPVSVYGEPIEHLLELLHHPVNGVRHRVRVELSGRDTEEVISALEAWTTTLDASDEQQAHALLEALWLHQQHNVRNDALLGRLLSSPVEHARFAALRVDSDWRLQAERARRTITPAMHAHEHSGHSQEMPPEEEEMPSNLEYDFTAEERAVFTMNAVPGRMLFDVAEFNVRPGQAVELTFYNPDNMPHNLVITSPDKGDEVYEAAIALRGEGFARQFVPDHPDVLVASRLLNRDERQVLSFVVPDQPGDYVFICTFPGHGTLMRGIMRVVGDDLPG